MEKHNSTEAQLVKIVSYRTGLSESNLSEMLEESLLGPKIRIPARELLHVYFDVEKIFGIRIPQKDIMEGRFKTVKNILEIIEENLPEVS